MTPGTDVPLSPLSFLDRTADIWGERVGVVADDGHEVTWSELRARSAKLADALRGTGVGPGSRVAVLAPNDVPLLEAHYGVPASGASLVALNTRLSAREYAEQLAACQAQVLIVDAALRPLVEEAVAGVSSLREVVVIGDDPEYGDYGAWLEASTDRGLQGPADERQPIAINFTSGSTGRPKAAVYTHRGAYLASYGQVVTTGLSPEARYLWTLPMFHCNGWCFTWAVTLAGATHVCHRGVEPDRILADLVGRGITHLCGAPVVADAITAAAARTGPLAQRVHFAVGGASPSPTAISAMERIGVDVVHLYGMTETYGPSLVCVPQPDWQDRPFAERAGLMARQGVRTPQVESVRVVDDALVDVPADGRTRGEIVVRSNTVLAEYLDDPAATAAAFRDGWLRSGDVAVRHPDGYVEIKDRMKDVIISGGENVSSIEVENAIREHDGVREVAVVARPHEKWGEVPVAFVTGTAELTADELVEFLRARLAGYKIPRARLAGYKIPRAYYFDELPKTSTGKVRKDLLRDQARTT